jgi:gamma-glutamylcyclotransferase (GGCT)/AIG2-like uncharacterized protein YtfP
MRELVFVYGTLMRAQPNHRVLVELGALGLGDATTAVGRTLVNLGPYPALLPFEAARDGAASSVFGELYALGDDDDDSDGALAAAALAALAALDAFEGCPALYRRERIGLEHAGAAIEAWTYVLARTAPRQARVVEGGRYLGGGIVLPGGAKRADILDKSAKISDVPPPRKPR